MGGLWSSTSVSRPPIDKLLQELGKPDGRMADLRSKVGINSEKQVRLEKEPLGRKRTDPWVFKVSTTESVGDNRQCVTFVVKLNPSSGRDKNLQDVRKEFQWLSRASTSGNVPKPIHCSTPDEAKLTGSDFMVMEFVDGKSFKDLSQIPNEYRHNVLMSVMETLGTLHRSCWGKGEKEPANSEDFTTQTAQFWEKEVRTWTDNFKATVGGIRWQLGKDEESYVFDKIQKHWKPSESERHCIVHGSLDIGNIIFDDQYNVKAILDWKRSCYGDPLSDVAYFLMPVFLRPSDYGTVTASEDNKLLLSDSTGELEDELVRQFDAALQHEYQKGDLAYAKAVSCLRLISVIKKASADKFKNHESGMYKEITSDPERVIEALREAAETLFQKWKAS